MKDGAFYLRNKRDNSIYGYDNVCEILQIALAMIWAEFAQYSVKSSFFLQ